jgi:hypothetical protein
MSEMDGSWGDFYNHCALLPGSYVVMWSSTNVGDYAAVAHWLEKEFLSDQNRLGLLRLLAEVASRGFFPSQTAMHSLGYDYSDSRIALSAAALRLTDQKLSVSDARECAAVVGPLLRKCDETNVGMGMMLFNTVQEHLRRVPALEQFVLTLRGSVSQEAEAEFGVAHCDSLLRLAVRNRLSGLQEQGKLAMLELPDLGGQNGGVTSA